MATFLPPISQEQREIILSLSQNNLIIDSVAGSGKTTTNLYIAQNFPSSKILLLTYNARLRLETKNKVKGLGLTNMDVHTYHSFCYKYFSNSCKNDSEMVAILNSQRPFSKTLDFDIIILDESQDIVPLFCRLIQKILHEMMPTSQPRICILGDKNQCIYKYNKADERYLLNADQLFFVKNFKSQVYWERKKLSQSFRLTRQMVEFINYCMLNENRIISVKEGPEVKYIICDSFNTSNSDSRPDSALYQIQQCLAIYKPDDIFILAPSLKSGNSPCRKFANLLTLKKIPIYVPNDEEETMSEIVMKNKVVFSTFHQAKGLERKVVFIYGFDSSYFKFYNKTANPKVCPNELYVAATRALEILVLIHDQRNDYLPFLNKPKLDFFTLKMGTLLSQIPQNENVFKYRTSVTELVRHLPYDVIEKALSLIKIEELNHEEEFIHVPCIVKQENIYYEDVSDINGVAIPAWFELQASKKTQTQKRTTIIERTKLFMKKNNNNLISTEELLKRANFWNSEKSGYKFKLKQISKFNWLTQDHLEKCMKRLKKVISPKADFETEVKMEGEPELHFRELRGYIDCWDRYNIWEFKCVNSLSDEHLLQLAVYMYLFESRLDIFRRKKRIEKKIKQQLPLLQKTRKFGVWIKKPKARMKYFLMNILSNKILSIKSDLKSLKEMISVLFHYKYGGKEKQTTEEFIKNNLFNK